MQQARINTVSSLMLLFLFLFYLCSLIERSEIPWSILWLSNSEVSGSEMMMVDEWLILKIWCCDVVQSYDTVCAHTLKKKSTGQNARIFLNTLRAVSRRDSTV